ARNSRVSWGSPSQRFLLTATALKLQPSGSMNTDFVTSGHPAVFPDSVPVTAQSTTPLFRAGTTSENAIDTEVAPRPVMKSRRVLLNTRIFLPLRSVSEVTLSRHHTTCGVLAPIARSSVFQLRAI